MNIKDKKSVPISLLTKEQKKDIYKENQKTIDKIKNIKCLECESTEEIYKQIKSYEKRDQDNKHVNFDIDINKYICAQCLSYNITDFIIYNFDVQNITVYDNDISDYKHFYNFYDACTDYDNVSYDFHDLYSLIQDYYFESVEIV